MTTATRDHILTCGGRIIHHKGFTATGLQEILLAAEVPKGSFYFYFKSKEEFGLALVDHYQVWFAEQVRPILKDTTQPPLERLAGFFLWFQRYFEQEGFIKGCPIGNLVQELGDVNPLFREKLKSSFDGLIRFMTRLLEEARKQGELPTRLEPEATARYIFSAWQGALIRMKATASSEPLDTFQQMTFKVLLKQ
ncbi:TetR/AcrR family transcriptional regulator [Desulfobulbus alkaliphilus]|uniref:TetR/AcrR family transcriptional regulator n=1 Tax=Desulfobulbus alkaliphilus TaxID=869814 RepID=UPI001964F2D0|nr:TetR/AcrR family transcriptional regulator [Desulfobulbus alkaliphilus]MBM9538685.1 TetR family transcriptional regulator C-terminal domain-containing protein [Desulfobulbus alkaliphilus]